MKNQPDRKDRAERLFQLTGLPLGPALFILINFVVHPPTLNDAAVSVLAITAWISVWWITEAVPLAITSLLPIVLFPLMGITTIKATTSSYGDPLIFLFMGGFMLAIAIEKTGLHLRMALWIIRKMGARLNMIVLGFMVATAFLSMWISNTASAIMMLPIGLSVMAVMPEDDEKITAPFGKGLMLAIAYGASIGGVGTLIGTPPNLIFAGILQEIYGLQISFIKWMYLGIPLVVVMLTFTWWYITRISFPLGNAMLPGGRETIREQYKLLGKMTSAQKRVATIFSLMAIAWMTRSFLLANWFPVLDDTIIAVLGGIVLFILPTGAKSERPILSWDDARKIPWGILLLFGGGLAIAGAFETSGLAAWIGNKMSSLEVIGPFLLIMVILITVNILTEFTSNTACAAMILPVLGPVALTAGLHPLTLMAGAAMISSYGFMMPAGTPPNAIAFGSGFLAIRDMIRTGFVLNIAAVILITLLTYFLAEILWVG